MMKKILLTTIINVSIAFGIITVNIDQDVLAATSDRYFLTGDPANTSAWSLTTGGDPGASVPAESTDVFLDANGNNAFTLGGNVIWRSITIASGYTANYSASGRTQQLKYGASTDGTGTFNWGNGLQIDSAGSTWHVGSGCGVQTGTSCAIVFNNTGTMDVDKASSFLSLTIAAGKTLTNTSSATNIFVTSGTPLTIGAASMFTSNGAITLRRSTTGDVVSLGAGYTWNGSGNFLFGPADNNNIKMTIPAITYTGTGAVTMRQKASETGDTIQFTGSCIFGGALNTNTNTAAGTVVYDYNNQSVTCAALRFGASSAHTTGFTIVNFGSGTITCTSMGSASDNQVATINFNSANFIVSANIILNANQIINAGTSLITLVGTIAQTITSNGKITNRIKVNNTGTGFVSPVDSLTCADSLILTDGPWNSVGFGIRCNTLIHVSTDSVRYQNLWLTGNYTRGSTATKSDTAAQHIRFLAGTSHTMAAAGKTYAQVTISGPTTINGGAVIRALSYGVDGVKGTLEAAKKVTINTLSIGGAAGALDSMVSGTAGAMDTVSCPQDTPAYVYIKDQYMVNSRYLPATSKSGGNNRNVKTLSYTGVTKDVSTGVVGTTITFTGSGFVGGCWIKFSGDSSALTVVSYTSATKAIPTLAAGVYAITVGNSDGDVASAGNFTVTAASTTTGRKPLGYGYKKYRY